MEPDTDFLLFGRLRTRPAAELADLDDPVEGLLQQHTTARAGGATRKKVTALVSYVQTGNSAATRPQALERLLRQLALDPANEWHLWIDEIGNESPHADWWLRAAPLLYGQVYTLGVPALIRDLPEMRRTQHMSNAQRLVERALPQLNAFLGAAALEPQLCPLLEGAAGSLALPPPPPTEKRISFSHAVQFAAAWLVRDDADALRGIVSTGWLQRPWPRMEWEVASLGPGYMLSHEAHVQLLRTVMLLRLLRAVAVPANAKRLGWAGEEVDSFVASVRAWLERDGGPSATGTETGTGTESDTGTEPPSLVALLDAERPLQVELEWVFARMGKVELCILENCDVGRLGAPEDEFREMLTYTQRWKTWLSSGAQRMGVPPKRVPLHRGNVAQAWQLQLNVVTGLNRLDETGCNPRMMYDAWNLMDWKMSCQLLVAGVDTFGKQLPPRVDVLRGLLGRQQVLLGRGLSGVQGGVSGFCLAQSARFSAMGVLTVPRMGAVFEAGPVDDELHALRKELNRELLGDAAVGSWVLLDGGVAQFLARAMGRVVTDAAAPVCVACLQTRVSGVLGACVGGPVAAWEAGVPELACAAARASGKRLPRGARVWALAHGARGVGRVRLVATWWAEIGGDGDMGRLATPRACRECGAPHATDVAHFEAQAGGHGMLAYGLSVDGGLVRGKECWLGDADVDG